jgi:uncharacterized membrane-anchored protein
MLRFSGALPLVSGSRRAAALPIRLGLTSAPMKTARAATLLSLSLLLPDGAFARGPEQAPAQPVDTPKALDYVSGEVSIGNGLAKLNVPESFRFLGPEDSERVLVELWGNPKSKPPLGMLFPADKDPGAEDGWGIVITFEEEGYVKDDEADKMDYAALLKDMKSGMSDENEARKKAGFEPIELVGWATPPRYDKAAKKLYWAKELHFGTTPGNTLNYNIRILGRRGVLVLNAVAGMNQLKEVEAATPAILGFVEFEPGHRYADFKPETDKLAAYGIGALIAGKVAAKAGLFKGLIALILAGKKFVLLALVALGAWLKKMFGAKEPKAEGSAQ